jgi:hypothetical protein
MSLTKECAALGELQLLSVARESGCFDVEEVEEPQQGMVPATEAFDEV